MAVFPFIFTSRLHACGLCIDQCTDEWMDMHGKKRNRSIDVINVCRDTYKGTERQQSRKHSISCRNQFAVSAVFLWGAIWLFSSRLQQQWQHGHLLHPQNEEDSAGEITSQFGLSTPRFLISCAVTSESTCRAAITQALVL